MFDPFSSPLLHFRDTVASRVRPHMPDYLEGSVWNPRTRDWISREVFRARAVVSCTESEVGELNQEKMLLFPGYHSLELVDSSYYARLQEELSIPSDRQLLAVVQETPLGWEDYVFDLIGSYVVPDDPPKAPRFWLHSPPSTRHRQKTQRSRQPLSPYIAFEPWSYPSAPPILIAWRRRVAYQKARAWLEVRWHPVQGETTTIYREAYAGPLEEAQQADEKLLAGRILMQRMGQPGRPRRTKHFRDGQDFRETMVGLIQLVDRKGEIPPTQMYIAELFMAKVTDNPLHTMSVTDTTVLVESMARLLRKYLKRYGFTSWEELVQLARMSPAQ